MTFQALSELSPGMRRGLIRCDTLIVEVLDERHCGIAPRTLAALQGHGLIHVTVDKRLRRVYRPTVAGSALLRTEEPLYLHRAPHRSYTNRVEMSLREDQVVDATGARRPVPVEAVPLATLEEYAADAAERRRGEPGRREEELRRRARSLAVRLKQAAIGFDPDGAVAHLDMLERQIVELERARETARRAA